MSMRHGKRRIYSSVAARICLNWRSSRANPKVPWQTPQKVSIPNLDLLQVKAIVAQARARGKLVRVHLGPSKCLTSRSRRCRCD